MSDREFQYFTKDASNASKPVSLTRVMAAAGKAVVLGRGPFTLTQDGDALKEDTSRSDVLKRLRKRLVNGDIGPTYRIRTAKKGVIFGARETAPAIRIIDTNGNDKADKYWSTIVATFPQYHPRFAGAYVCKHIAGSSQMSQHSYGNAVDIFFDSLTHQDDVFHWVIAHADELSIDHAISQRNIWTRGEGIHYYSGEYHYHLHVDFVPQYSGSCGVRG